MDSPSLSSVGWDTYLLGLIIALVVWIFNREINRLNTAVKDNLARLSNHSQRLSQLDGKTEDS